jgi:hypothetical protein
VEILRRALATPPERRVAMGRAARVLVEGQYATRLMARKYESLYEEIIRF